MDVDAAYARWIRRRLLVLLPAAAGAALLGLHLALEDDLRGSARLSLLAVVALVQSVFVSATGLALLCHRLHRARGAARAFRRLLEPAERLVAPAALLLLPVALAPAAFRRPEPPPPALAFALPIPVRRPPPPPVVEAPEAVAPPAPAPEPPPPPPLPPAAPESAGGDENEVFRLLHEDLEPPPTRLSFDRLGVPDDERPLENRPLSLEVEALLLLKDDASTGAALSLRFEFPIDGGPTLRLSTLYLVEDERVLSHTTLDASVRLWGGTRGADLDLWLSVGLALDRAEVDGLDADGRLAPHVALDLTLWQGERVGFSLRIGQTLPVSAGAAAVTDASAAVRVDLSERISLRAGWRYLVLRPSDDALDAAGALAELDRDLSGPFLGVEIRF